MLKVSSWFLNGVLLFWHMRRNITSHTGQSQVFDVFYKFNIFTVNFQKLRGAGI